MTFREYLHLDELKNPVIARVKSPTGHRSSPKGMPKAANLGVNTGFKKFSGINTFGQPNFQTKKATVDPNK